MSIQKDPEGTEIFHLEEMTAFAGQNVLEIGCGDGRLTWRYAASAGCVTGIDQDGETLSAAVTACPGNLQKTVSFVRANSLALPFPHEEFDIAILAWSF